MSKKRQFLEERVTKLKFSYEALDPIKTLYHDFLNGSLPGELAIGVKAHEDYSDEFKDVSMRWYFAKSELSMQIFRDVLDSCELQVVRGIVGQGFDKMRVLQANIIEIRGGYPTGRWHSDFTDEDLLLNQSATLLTPLLDFKSHFGGLETTAVLRGESVDYEERAIVHKYSEGEAILFDGTGTIHRTQSYKADPAEKRVLVCWQLGEVDDTMVPVFERIGEKNGDPMFMHAH
ncbi:hypothetical protein [Pseudomonas syringae]|uniref:hypothetical protein n=3 Tax=Pseudomonas syringae TaxID=317 RepID=UPI001F317148|nr:hypothetical protein [Pseudomonas syringae]MCF5471081.1 hypothetical protein [Pseudomonas syringae]MCF5471574.1 hypothetical protein [Pseudomonas syringae]MCF5486040.1 hypothetical protein [Pseudomonas syringae]MCF5495641.1 hypothetical protein [Pseudomonas syringae]MCF5501006.1 hypothetical protein [Pseudomonas syringae]